MKNGPPARFDSAFSKSYASAAWLLERAVHYMSFEFLFRWIPNGGTAVLLRSVFVSLLIYLPSIGLKSYTSGDVSFQFDGAAFRALINDTIPWLGAIFAGVYAAFYSRFAAQWQYLAGLYNQIMATASTMTIAERNSNKSFQNWRAGFIEDAIALHLATKPMFAYIIVLLLDDADVRLAFEKTTKDGPMVAKQLRQRLRHIKP